MTKQIRLRKIAAVLSIVFTFLAVHSVYAQQKPDNRTSEQKTADFRTWDRLDSGQISPDSFTNSKTPEIRDKAREMVEKRSGAEKAQQSEQRTADFRTWDRLDSGQISPDSFVNSPNPSIRDKAREMVEKRGSAAQQQQMAEFRLWDRLDSGAVSPESFLNSRSPAIREKARQIMEERAAAGNSRFLVLDSRSLQHTPGYRMPALKGSFGPGGQRQVDGGLMMSRNQRMLYLPNEDRILLPITALWDGYANISVKAVTPGRGSGYYEVAIRTKGGPSLERKIISYVERNGPWVAARVGLLAVPGGPFVQAGISVGMNVIKPTPLTNGEGEWVRWDIRSASGTHTRVFLIHEK